LSKLVHDLHIRTPQLKAIDQTCVEREKDDAWLATCSPLMLQVEPPDELVNVAGTPSR
jgi:hypothetical protein